MTATSLGHPSTRTPADIAEAHALLRRWDAQQTGYIRHRAERFATITRVVAGVLDAPAGASSDTRTPRMPRILDLAAGPGSLAHSLRAELPDAHLVVADKDPALLQIATETFAGDIRAEIAAVDLADPSWVTHPAIAGAPFDAVVSSTALHWLQPETLVRVYRALAQIVRPGGIVLNGDHLSYDAAHEPTLRELAARDDQAVQSASFTTGTTDGTNAADTWDAWWDAVAAVPRYRDALAERDRVWGEELHIAPPTVTLEFHLAALRSAGFRETGTVWRYLDDIVLYAIR